MFNLKRVGLISCIVLVLTGTLALSAIASDAPIRFEGENTTSINSGVTTTNVTDPAASGGGYFQTVASTTQGSWVEFTVSVPSTGVYNLDFGYKKNYVRGTTQLTIDGLPQGGSVDQYASSASYTESDLGNVVLSSGNHKFRFNVIGKNASSTSYNFTVDYLQLTLLSTRFEGENSAFTTSGVTTSLVSDAAASGGGYFQTGSSTTTGSWVEYTLNVPATGVYNVNFGYKKNYVRGTTQLAIDGVNQGIAVDQYANTASYVSTNLGNVTLSSGNHTFRFTVTGKNTSSTSYNFTIDYLELMPNFGPAVDPSLMSNVSGTNPINFLSDLAPGNYDITLILGDNASAGSTNVQAEARRTMLGTVATEAGKLSLQNFTVNVREPEGQPTGGSNGEGTPGLNFSLSGIPKLNGIGISPAQNPSMIYLAGDSTMSDWLSNPTTGWGQMLPQYFKIGTSIANYADPGESTVSYLSDNALFNNLISHVNTNDYVLIQFGHNDKTTTKASYQANLKTMITQIKAKGAVPVLITPVVRRLFNEDNLTLSSTALHINEIGVDLPAAMKEVASTNNVQLIDLTAKSKLLIESLGVEASKPIYLTVEKDDNTHFSKYGANEIAKLVLQGMKELNLPQVANLR
ncbi:GDSL-type esterase/lipase family protein [Paenibacillus whitsoniae]|uniref:CBM6 domain-containing protein n=1 Tax=Paenibacillus whitsoniae TaxID=2496558 RepID=A0A3S0A6Q4_9BACL|nr:GDSL-type esterase/lipase family protein [Paenibacillus whitsoniae]RTE10881.1 hypothetical protein EJQ19_06365 [Paenibacillus whitsoniae]